MREEVVQDARVQDGLARELLAKLVALNRVLLLRVVEEKFDLDPVDEKSIATAFELHLPTFRMGFDRPALGSRGVEIAVDDAGRIHNLGLTEKDFTNMHKTITFAHPLHDGSVPTTYPIHRELEFMHESCATESKLVGHDVFPSSDVFASANVSEVASGLPPLRRICHSGKFRAISRNFLLWQICLTEQDPALPDKFQYQRARYTLYYVFV